MRSSTKKRRVLAIKAGDNLVMLTDGRLAVTDNATFLRLREGITYGFDIAATGDTWAGGMIDIQTDNKVYRITGVCKEGHL